MTTQTEAMKRWVEVFDGNWHDEPVDSEWADRAHQALAEMRQAIAEAEQPVQPDPDYAWPTVQDYEADVGFKVNDAFQMGWDMARTTNDLFKQMGAAHDLF